MSSYLVVHLKNIRQMNAKHDIFHGDKEKK